MQLRKVAQKWPPDWGSSYGKGDTFVSGEAGVLSGVKLLKDHIQLGARLGEKEVLGQLRAKDQKTLERVMKVLGPSVGKPLKEVGDLDIPEK